MFFPQKSPRRDLRGLFQGSAFAASLRRSGGRKRRYTIIETMTFRLSAVTWDQTSPYIPTRWFRRYSKSYVSTGLNELERLGYLERRQMRDEQGRFIDTEYVIYEVPRSTLPPDGNPETENPEAASPPPEKPPQLNTNA